MPAPAWEQPTAKRPEERACVGGVGAFERRVSGRRRLPPTAARALECMDLFSLVVRRACVACRSAERGVLLGTEVT